jgi:hypothetical protein
MYNEIQTVTGRTGAQTRALYSQISQSGCCGTSPQGDGSTQNPFIVFPANDVRDLYVSTWIKLQPDLAQRMLSGDPWRSLFEIKTQETDWRLSVGAVDWSRTGTPIWQVKTDSMVGSNYSEIWRQYANAVPIDRWFKLEVFVHRSSGSDGRVWVAADGNVLADRFGPNLGPKGNRIDRIFLTLLYSGSTYPIYQWVDDVQIWSTFPSAAPGDAWYNPPYGPH